MILIIIKILNNAWYCLVLTQKVTMLSLKNYAQQKLNPPKRGICLDFRNGFVYPFNMQQSY